MVSIATRRYCREVKCIPERIAAFIYVSFSLVSLMLERSSIFPREEVQCMIGLCRRYFVLFVIYQATMVLGVPVFFRVKTCLVCQ